MIDIILGVVLVFILGGASYGTWKQIKSGGCSGCSGCNCKDKSSCPSQEKE